ncbi:alpha/beta hydrolase [Iamia majanohamensis]|uniref:Alpha/beta hydrolase n=1 Tax=Iamia majanohamensis TaxID=467976 RepID=A0AAE9Y594_9ACTN|nr:alpha/beta hydrolase [Iamia majanohamensis]WCO66627.1 alpha/beta hydrolase [Iamia majanohamensis]
MRPTTRTLLRLAGVAAAGVVAERVVARRVRSRTVPEVDHLLTPPDDVRHLTVRVHDGGELHVVERGEGRPLVLLHGITLNAELWSPQLHDLARDHRVLAVDLRGHGRSVPGDDGYGMDVLGRDVASLLTEIDLRDALVVGHSMGGMATLAFAVDHPEVRRERVAGLGLVATAAARPFPNALVPRLAALGGTIVERLDSGRPVPSYRFSGNDLSLFLIRSVFGREASGAAIEQVRASIEATDDEALQRSLVGIFDHDATEGLPEVDTPAFVVVGRRDVLTPVPFARAMAEGLPDAELTVLPGAGHQLMQERPDELAGLIRDLAARTAPVGAGT